MKRLALAVVLGGASLACGFAAVGVALYAQGPYQLQAAFLFGGFGMVAGLICAGLHLKFDGMQVHERAVVSAEALAAMVRAAVAGAAAERAARPGSAADRRSVPGVPATPAAAAPSSIGVQAVTSSGPAGPSNRATAPEAEVAGSVLNA